MAAVHSYEAQASTEAKAGELKTHTFAVKGTIAGTNTVTPSNACGPHIPLFVGKGTGFLPIQAVLHGHILIAQHHCTRMWTLPQW